MLVLRWVTASVHYFVSDGLQLMLVDRNPFGLFIYSDRGNPYISAFICINDYQCIAGLQWSHASADKGNPKLKMVRKLFSHDLCSSLVNY